MRLCTARTVSVVVGPNALAVVALFDYDRGVPNAVFLRSVPILKQINQLRTGLLTANKLRRNRIRVVVLDKPVHVSHRAFQRVLGRLWLIVSNSFGVCSESHIFVPEVFRQFPIRIRHLIFFIYYRGGPT